MTTIKDIYNFIDRDIAPYRWAEAWDPCDFQIGHADAEVQKVLLALDINQRSVDRALAEDIDLIVTHHPVLFSAMQKITDEHYENSWLLSLIENKIGVISAHTNLDKANRAGTATAMVAMFEEGGPIKQTKPLEVLAPEAEEPEVGLGRILRLDKAYPAAEIVAQLKKGFAQPQAWFQKSQKDTYRSLCFSPGAFDDGWLHVLRERDVDLLVVGELKHHHKLALEGLDIAFVELNHEVSERCALPFLKAELAAKFPALDFALDMGIDYTETTSN